MQAQGASVSGAKSKATSAQPSSTGSGSGPSQKGRVRKQSWRSLNIEEDPLTPQSPGPISNPWKTLNNSSNHGGEKFPCVFDEEKPDLQQILREESVQNQNLTKAKSKPFHVTQLEEKAMAELRTFYNVDNVFDEFITIERVDQRVLATPIWKKSK